MNDITSEALHTLFKQSSAKTWHVQELQRHLGIRNSKAIKKCLQELTKKGVLTRTKRRSYALDVQSLPTQTIQDTGQTMTKTNMLTQGYLQVTAQGYGFILSDNGGQDMMIAEDALKGAWDGDLVSAKPRPGTRGRPKGEIIDILERKNDHLVGTLKYSRGYALLQPDDPKARSDIKLLPDSVDGAQEGTRLIVKMFWPEETGEREAYGEVVETLGDGTDDNGEVETRAVVVRYHLKDTFDPETLEEASLLPDEITPQVIKNRVDMRHVNTFTIDGEDAKDFDDALSVERLKGGGRNSRVRIGIHIADVSHYVKEGSHLDQEARERATSVYLPGHVLPMLPEKLSNDLCSLVEGEPRLALAVIIEMSRDGQVRSMQLQESVIKSNARLTYEQVQAYLDAQERLPHGKRKLEPDIQLLADLSQTLRQARLSKGALDFDFTEAKVDVRDGKMQVNPIHTSASRQLIEELMLLANRLVAEELSTQEAPALYRVHEEPAQSKMVDLQKNLAKLGYDVDLVNGSPEDLQAVIQAASGKPEAQLVNILLLRSLKQARYLPEDKGHFGLAFDHYLHFTSPIRRYPDLIVHRVVRALLQKKLTTKTKAKLAKQLPELAEHTSNRERKAEEAERDLTRYYHALWAREHIGEVMEGTITGIMNYGIFVALANGVEGLLHVSELQGEPYNYDESAIQMVGQRTGKRYRLGNRLSVCISASNPAMRQIDFATPEPPKKHQSKAVQVEKAVKAETGHRAKASKTSAKAPASPHSDSTTQNNRKGRSNDHRSKGQNRKKDSRAPQNSHPAKAKAPDRQPSLPPSQNMQQKQPPATAAATATAPDAAVSAASASAKRKGKRRVLVFGKIYTR